MNIINLPFSHNCAQQEPVNRMRRFRPLNLSVRVGAILILVGLLVASSYVASSATFANKISLRHSPTAAPSTRVANSYSKMAWAGILPGSLGTGAWRLTPLTPPLAPLAESIATFEVVAGVCTATPKNSFNLGETVCAKITGADLGADGRAARRIGWVSPYGSLAQGAEITTDPQTGYYVIPASATQTFIDDGGGTVTFDNRGTWRVGTYSTSDGSLREVALFTVHDPAKAFVDLSVNQGVGVLQSQVNSGSGSVFELFVTNNGPDTAQDVVLSDTLSDNATFSAIFDDGFTCGTPVGTLFTCTLASMPAGTTKHLTLSYMVNGDTPVGAIITNNLK